MTILDGVKKTLEPKKTEPDTLCPLCKNNSLVPWVIRQHEGNVVSDNPTIHTVGSRCEKCAYTMVYAPWIVFHFFNFGVREEKMLRNAVERCVIDHRKDCIPKEVWDFIVPGIKKEMAFYRAQECVAPPMNTPEYWESDHWSVICYEAFGKCVWGFD
jgi:hypothetical protein